MMEDEYLKALSEFMEYYKPLAIKHKLRLTFRDSIDGEATIEINQVATLQSKKPVRKILTVKEEDAAGCYRVALKELKYKENTL